MNAPVDASIVQPIVPSWDERWLARAVPLSIE